MHFSSLRSHRSLSTPLRLGVTFDTIGSLSDDLRSAVMNVLSFFAANEYGTL